VCRVGDCGGGEDSEVEGGLLQDFRGGCDRNLNIVMSNIAVAKRGLRHFIGDAAN
jgi:hypothetical protein